MPNGYSGNDRENHMQMLALVAKTDSESENLWLPLMFHLRDTAAVMEYLTQNWLPQRYCDCLGLKHTDFLTLAKAAALFHDVGKSTKIFQEKITRQRPELRERLRHMGLDAEFSLTEQPAESIPHAAAGAELLRWRLTEEGADEKEAQDSALAAIVGAHHGKTEDGETASFLIKCPKEFGWTGKGNSNTPWGAVQETLIDWAEEQTGDSSWMQLPTCSMAAQMALTGLVIMADWIASNTAYFPLIPIEEMPDFYDETRAERAFQKLRLPGPWIISDAWKAEDYFKRRFTFEANVVQETMDRVAAQTETPGVMILEAPMGHGKTEAALSAAEILMNRFHLGGAAFFLPSQATSNAMFARMTQWAQHQPDAVRVAVELIPGQAAFNAEFAALDAGSVRVAQDEPVAESLTVHSFFRGRKTGLLANLVVGTVDQLLMAALQQKHVMLRQLGLTGKVVIIDECHAYDAYMNVYLDRVLNWLGAYRVPVILLSATLPGKRRAQLLRAYLGERRSGGKEAETAQEYPLLSLTQGDKILMEAIPAQGQSRCVAIRKTEEESALAEAGRILEHGCVGMIVNTVKRAQMLWEKLKTRYPNAEILMDHSQFLVPDRLEHEREILRRVGKHSDGKTRKGVLVIGTQVLEQSLDLDFDLLITDLCPMDLLLQRIGRLHRHERTRPTEAAEARCLVLGANGELDGGSRAVYGDYLLLRTREFLPETIRLPEDISPLVQKTYGKIDLLQTDAQYETAWQQYQKEQDDQKNKAKSFLLPKPERDPLARFAEKTIVGIMNGGAPGFTDLQARAAVRDGTASIEVLVVQRTEDGMARLLSGEQKGMEIRTDTQPSREEARAIAMQRLRLPARFSQSYCVDSVIDELETVTARFLPEWMLAPMLQGEAFLILEPDGKAELNGEKLRYDPQIGLIREDEHGAN